MRRRWRPAGRQEPFRNGALSRQILHLAQASAPSTSPSPAAAQMTAKRRAAEPEFRASVKASEDPADIRVYVTLPVSTQIQSNLNRTDLGDMFVVITVAPRCTTDIPRPLPMRFRPKDLNSQTFSTNCTCQQQAEVFPRSERPFVANRTPRFTQVHKPPTTSGIQRCQVSRRHPTKDHVLPYVKLADLRPSHATPTHNYVQTDVQLNPIARKRNS